MNIKDVVAFSSEKSPNLFQMESRTTSCLRKMSAEMLDNAEETIIDYITCPHCNDYIKPPSFCCENGHFICCECKPQITKCPSCDTNNYPNKSNLVFDMILKDIYYPCSYQGNGCAAYFKFDELKQHHLICEFKLEQCCFQSLGCPLYLKDTEKLEHEAKCQFGASCRIYAKIKGALYTECNWKGKKEELLDHVIKAHQLAWCPHQIDSNVALSWMLPTNFDFEKVELIHLKDFNELFYFYSKTIGHRQHYIAVQYIGNSNNWNQFMYSVEFSYEEKKVGYEDLVIPYNITNEDIYKSNNCFYIDYEFLTKHFLAERLIDCHVKVFKKEQKKTLIKRCLTTIDNIIAQKEP